MLVPGGFASAVDSQIHLLPSGAGYIPTGLRREFEMNHAESTSGIPDPPDRTPTAKDLLTSAADGTADANESAPSDAELAHWDLFGHFVQSALRYQERSLEPVVVDYIGPFQVIEVLAQGGNGTVYLARDPALPRTVAVKVPRADLLSVAGTRERFLQEAKLVAGLKHPQIVEIHQIGEWNGQPFLVFEYCDGGSLSNWLATRHQTLSPQACAEICKLLASAVQHAHSQGILHRDLNPRNVLLSAVPQNNWSALQDEFPFVIKLSDFGLGTWLNPNPDAVETQTGAVVGTIPYMAPEQTSGTSKFLQPTVDVHALGVILFELLAGSRPYSGDTPLETLRMIQETAPPMLRRVRRNVPRDLETICLKCLEKSPRQRYQSAQHLAEDLDRFLSQRPILAHRASLTTRAVQWMTRHPLVAFMSALICLLCGLIGIGTAWYSARLAHSIRTASQLKSQSLEYQDKVQDMAYAGQIRRAQELLEAGYDFAAGELLRQWIPTAQQRDRRNFEWYYLNQATGGQRMILRRQPSSEDSIYCASVSPDGKSLYLGTESSIEQWDLRQRRLTQKLKLTDNHPSVRDIFAARNGDLYFSRGGLSGIYRWSKDHNAERGPLRPPVEETRYCNRVTMPLDEDQIISLTSHAPPFHPPTTVQSMDVKTGKVIWEMTPPNLHAFDLVVDNKSKRIVMIVGFQLLVLTSSGAIVQAMDVPGETSQPLSLALSKDCEKLVIALEDRGLLLCQKNGVGNWESAGELPIQRQVPVALPSDRAPYWFTLRNPIAFSSDNNRLFSACDTELHLWDVNRRSELQALKQLPNPVRALKLLPGGNTVAWASALEVGLWQPQARFPSLAGHARETWAVRFSPNGRLLATGSDDETIKIWDAHSGQELQTFRGHTATVSAVSFSPDSRQIASSGLDGTIRIWSLDQTSQPESQTLRGHQGTVRCLDWSSDGQSLISGDYIRKGPSGVIVWDLKQLRPQQTWHDQRLRIRAALFLKNGRDCVTVSEDMTAILRDVQSGKIKRTIRDREQFHSAVLLNADRWLATGSRSGIVSIWELESGKLIRELRGHAVSVRALTVSPDGELIASGSEDTTVRVWDLASGECLLILKGHSAPVNSVAFSPSGAVLASGAHDGSVKMWHAPRVMSP